MAAGNKRISELAVASPLELSDHIVVERGAAPPNFKATIQQVIDFAAAGSGTTNFIPLWVGPGTLGNSIASQAGAGIKINAGLSGASPNTDYDNLVVESNVDGGANYMVGANRFAGLSLRSSTGSASLTFDTNNHDLELNTSDADGTIALRSGVGSTTLFAHADGSVTVGGTLHPTNMDDADLLLQSSLGGALILGDRAAPTADFGFGKLYTLDGVLPSWMDHLGVASVLAFTGAPPAPHTIASHSDTSATGAQLDALVGGGNVDSLHSHSTANLDDTTATGPNLDTLTDGSNADALHVHASGGSSFRLIGTAPALIWEETDAGVDDGKWQILADGEQFIVQLLDDAETGTTDLMKFKRSGMFPDFLEIFESMSIIRSGTSAAQLDFKNDDANWQLANEGGGSGEFALFNNDIGSRPLQVHRTATNFALSIGAAGLVGFGIEVATAQVHARNSQNGATQILADNPNGGASASAQVMARSDSAEAYLVAQGTGGTGDAYTVYDDLSGSVWATGIDKSNGDRYVISQAAALGSTNRLEMETSGRTKLIRGTSGVTADTDYDDFQVHSNVDAGITVAIANNRFGGFKVSSVDGSFDMAFDDGTQLAEIATHSATGAISLRPGVANTTLFCHADASVTIGGSLHPTNMDDADLLLQGTNGGALILGDRSAPSNDFGFAKLYTLDGNSLEVLPSIGLARRVVTSSKTGTLDSIVLGLNGTERGTITLWDGPGGNTASYLHLHSRNGTERWLFIEDDGTLKLATKGVPVNNADGIVVGAQT